jgi:hypothetical protein
MVPGIKDSSTAPIINLSGPFSKDFPAMKGLYGYDCDDAESGCNRPKTIQLLLVSLALA